jgi:SAM-dependent methyltransferase
MAPQEPPFFDTNADIGQHSNHDLLLDRVKIPSSPKKDVAQEKSYWASFYSKFTLAIPSQFCVSTATEVKADQPIVEFGCGNGRDSIYLASQGFIVRACDLSKEAIEHNKAKSTDHGGIEFAAVDATNREEVESIIHQARTQGSTGNVTVYSRFFLHSIDEAQEDLFLDALSAALVHGDEIRSEYRSKEDEILAKVHGKGHYRRYIDTPALVQKLKQRGFETIYEITGRGMAKYKNEDPFVSRIIVRKN